MKIQEYQSGMRKLYGSKEVVICDDRSPHDRRHVLLRIRLTTARMDIVISNTEKTNYGAELVNINLSSDAYWKYSVSGSAYFPPHLEISIRPEGQELRHYYDEYKIDSPLFSKYGHLILDVL